MRPTQLIRWSLVCIAALALAMPAIAGKREPDLQILFVGNSFSRGIRRPLRDMFQAVGIEAAIKSRAPSAFTLRKHEQSYGTRRTIERVDWDYVFLQENSRGMKYFGYQASRSLDQLIRGKGGQTVLFMTWLDRGDPAAGYVDLLVDRQGEEGYLPLAYELDVPVAPIGWAIRNSILFDDLPIDPWGRKGHHLNRQGRYLAACVIFATITRMSPVGLFSPKKMKPEQARYLEELAADTVLGDSALWNILGE